MSGVMDLPEGWDTYDPNLHELTGQPDYEAARTTARTRRESGESVYWFAQIGDAHLHDSEGYVLLFSTEEAAVAAGIAEWQAPEYVVGIPARLPQSGRS